MMVPSRACSEPFQLTSESPSPPGRLSSPHAAPVDLTETQMDFSAKFEEGLTYAEFLSMYGNEEQQRQRPADRTADRTAGEVYAQYEGPVCGGNVVR